MIALYSPSGFERDDVTSMHLVGGHVSGKLILRELGRFYSGVFLVERWQVGMIYRSTARQAA